MHTYTHTHMHTHIHTYTHTWIHRVPCAGGAHGKARHGRGAQPRLRHLPGITHVGLEGFFLNFFFNHVLVFLLCPCSTPSSIMRTCTPLCRMHSLANLLRNKTGAQAQASGWRACAHAHSPARAHAHTRTRAHAHRQHVRAHARVFPRYTRTDNTCRARTH